MEENIIGLIKKAEEQAAARKAQAQLDAAEIVTAAEKASAEMSKASEENTKVYIEQSLKEAEARADEDYLVALQKSRESAEQAATELLEYADIYVTEIVGRLTK